MELGRCFVCFPVEKRELSMKRGASEMDGSADETSSSATTKTLDYLKPMYEPSPQKIVTESAVKFSDHRHVLY